MRFLFLVVLIYISLNGANIDDFAKESGFQRDFIKAMEKAKQEDKPLMMVLSADYCPWCRKFEKQTLNSKLIKDVLDKDIVTLIVDKKYDKDSFPEKFNTRMTPRVFFINPHTQDSFSESAGYIKKSEFKKTIDNVKNIYRGK